MLYRFMATGEKTFVMFNHDSYWQQITLAVPSVGCTFIRRAHFAPWITSFQMFVYNLFNYDRILAI